MGSCFNKYTDLKSKQLASNFFNGKVFHNLIDEEYAEYYKDEAESEVRLF